MTEEKKKLSPGRWMGVLAFITTLLVLLGLVIGYIIGMIQGIETDISATQIVNLTSLLFVVTWGAVFGSGMMEKYKGEDYKKTIKNIEVKVEEMQSKAGEE